MIDAAGGGGEGTEERRERGKDALEGGAEGEMGGAGGRERGREAMMSYGQEGREGTREERRKQPTV